MLRISRFAVEDLTQGCVTDERRPHFSFALESDRQDVALSRAVLTVGDWKTETKDQIAIPYGGPSLEPFTAYQAELEVMDNGGETAYATLRFETGRLHIPWKAKWISDGEYSFTEKKVSPKPMTFRRALQLKEGYVKAEIYATAMGIYELFVNGKKAGDRYFAPGFTSYKTNLQYQVYDVTGLLLSGENLLEAVVAGGWAVGSFVFTRKNRVTADRQALLLELRLSYPDGSVEVIGTDEEWDVTEDGPFQMADLYDGETYDATVRPEQMTWRKASKETLKVHPEIRADYSAPVKCREMLDPVSCTPHESGVLIYDFGQNFAGVIDLEIEGYEGEVVTVRHAEILNPDGSLNVQFLRTAKASAIYTCREGHQHYSPRFTYMGFRYVSVAGIPKERVTVRARVLTSDVERTGDFSCSNEMLNRLQENIIWGAMSNFMDIPTDCPQRDERMGWTGDIAVFSPTACFNFDMSRFLGKWMKDLAAEQLRTGGVPNTIPLQGFGFPATMPVMAVDWWDDAVVLVPWALYQARGDEDILRKYYPNMKRYIKACTFWAGLFSTGKKRYIWHTPATLHFGDWVAPDVPKMQQWQARSKWTATASLKNTSGLVAKIAQILGYPDEAEKYEKLSRNVADAYTTVLMDEDARLSEEFQTGYVLPLYLEMFTDPEKKAKAAANLARLVKKSNYCIGTGFPGTPYILFALADNGYEEEAYQMLLNTKCPSWLYEVKQGATTIWERWDGLDENGQCPISNDGTDMMISYNHYASGAVGDFLYRRVAGLQMTKPGYQSFRVKPIPGGGLTNARACVKTPYGLAAAEWFLEGDEFTLNVMVPVGCSCEVVLPNGETHTVGSGNHQYEMRMNGR